MSTDTDSQHFHHPAQIRQQNDAKTCLNVTNFLLLANCLSKSTFYGTGVYAPGKNFK
jgi:hypothetical protein